MKTNKCLVNRALVCFIEDVFEQRCVSPGQIHSGAGAILNCIKELRRVML